MIRPRAAARRGDLLIRGPRQDAEAARDEFADRAQVGGGFVEDVAKVEGTRPRADGDSVLHAAIKVELVEHGVGSVDPQRVVAELDSSLVMLDVDVAYRNLAAQDSDSH
ncbi:hypothetical protein [Nocardioides acrostichi]|uniref:Uncharacterized protein n=1 Tax=Nocardioides acrostichi TaxID=2784339 RepID=A0A930V531_9ACTN|nr:hypothetical protein [Nocardioides acrostichi]MBF4163996.1 hypothetical protein [Nocardioides acrostichi]